MASESTELMHRQYIASPKGSLWAEKRVAKLIYGEQIIWGQLRKVRDACAAAAQISLSLSGDELFAMTRGCSLTLQCPPNPHATSVLAPIAVVSASVEYSKKDPFKT
ncbi:hypothetical protein PTTW11_02888 [Pyrenophora teres f. teres]|uniref:Uncharacterized protein n=1 Tax=Pyrenophora teres f. teres TaxID=97479 RepID=A0A6S6VCC3_9PLEO|nr:hypothetical protein PTNB29_01354 [Pyrenophora teres f. teres]CAE7015993.1 hypothetical protein PTTW11_02888 [Pyrenophora teres f. teres]